MDIEKINVGGTQYDVCDTVARAALSDEFSTGGTYAVGDYCIYENTLYKFTAAKEPGAWDASKVAATQIGDELSQLNGKIITVNNGVVKIGGVAILQRGVQTITLSTTEQDYTIDFNEDFLGWPSVTFSVQRAGYASQTYAVLKSRGAQGFTITAASGANSNLAVTISWIAMYTPD